MRSPSTKRVARNNIRTRHGRMSRKRHFRISFPPFGTRHRPAGRSTPERNGVSHISFRCRRNIHQISGRRHVVASYRILPQQQAHRRRRTTTGRPAHRQRLKRTSGKLHQARKRLCPRGNHATDTRRRQIQTAWRRIVLRAYTKVAAGQAFLHQRDKLVR